MTKKQELRNKLLEEKKLNQPSTKWIKVVLTEEEKSKLQNFANQNQTGLTSVLRYLIHKTHRNLDVNKITDYQKNDRHETAFNLNKLDVDILEREAAKFNLSKNQFAKLLIANIEDSEIIEKEEINKRIYSHLTNQEFQKFSEVSKQSGFTQSSCFRFYLKELDVNSIKIHTEKNLEKKMQLMVSESINQELETISYLLNVNKQNLIRSIILQIINN